MTDNQIVENDVNKTSTADDDDGTALPHKQFKWHDESQKPTRTSQFHHHEQTLGEFRTLFPCMFSPPLDLSWQNSHSEKITVTIFKHPVLDPISDRVILIQRDSRAIFISLLASSQTNYCNFKGTNDPMIRHCSLSGFCFLLICCSTSSFQGTAPQRQRQLTPPFPNGPCGGEVITIPPEHTFGIDVNLANVNLGGDLILPPRPIHVWLPPGYDTADEKHPVLYCHDGQNALQDSWSWTGASWRMAGALTRLGDHGLINGPLPIVVMLESASGDIFPGIRRRHLEYGDVNVFFAQAHADFVANTVKPLVDNQFRTNSTESYAIGSSLGGQASLHLLLRHPTLFCGAACMSPAFGPFILNEIRRQKRSQASLRNKRIYLDIGGDFGDSKVPLVDFMDHLTTQHWWNPGYFWLDTQLQRSVEAMTDALDKAGVEYCFRTIPGGRHNERAWAQRIDKPLLHLFSGNADTD